MSDIIEDCTLTPPVNTVIPLDIVLDTDPVGINTGSVQLTEPLNPPITTIVPLNIDYDPECIGVATGVVELTAPIADYIIDLGMVTETSGLVGVVELTAPINTLTIDVDAVRGQEGPKGDPGDEGPQGDPGVGIVNHGDDPNYPRPDHENPVVWEGTVLPLNWLEEDIWINPEVATTPIYAGSIALLDGAGLFTASNVEGALAELHQAIDESPGTGGPETDGFTVDGGSPSSSFTRTFQIDFGGAS